MKVFRRLTIKGSRRELEKLLQEIESRLAEGWERDRKREKELAALALSRVHCFACPPSGNRPASRLFLGEKNGTLYVTNIVPTGPTNLTYDQYNLILQEFYERFVEPAKRGLSVRVELTADTVNIEDCLSEEAAKLLKFFSHTANRSILHPLDDDRWREFLIAAHRQPTELNSELLRRWLIEEEKWPEDRASDLAQQYDFALELLDAYKQAPAR